MADPHLQHPRPRGQGGRHHRGPRIPKTIRFPEEVAIEIETDLAGRGVTFNDYVVELVLKARAAAAAAAPNGGPVAAVLPAARKGRTPPDWEADYPRGNTAPGCDTAGGNGGRCVRGRRRAK
jgi:hypothetical protein